MKMKNLSLFALLFLATACSLPGGNDLNAPDETEKEQRNPRYLEKIYEPIRGEYTLQLQQTDSSLPSRCVVLDIDYKVTEEGKNSVGQPVFNVSLYGKYSDVDSFINEEVLTGRYYPENGTIAFILPSKQSPQQTSAAVSDKTLQITGQLLNGKLAGDLRVEGYAAGNLRGKLTSESTCPTKSKLRQDFSSRLESLVSGDWEGSAEPSGTVAGFKTKLRIVVQKIPVAGGFNFDVIANFDREPFGMLKPTPVYMTIALNQEPYVVNFTAVNATEWPKFYGIMKDADTVEGTLIYPAVSLKAVFKRKK